MPIIVRRQCGKEKHEKLSRPSCLRCGEQVKGQRAKYCSRKCLGVSQRASPDDQRRRRTFLQRQRRAENPDKYREENLMSRAKWAAYGVKWRQENRAKINARTQEKRANDPSWLPKRKARESIPSIKARINQKKRERYARLKHTSWYTDLLKNRAAKTRIRLRERFKTDLNFRILSALRCRLRLAVRRAGMKKCAKTVELIGCEIPFLRSRLESLFRDGMSWANYGKDGWHIDHIRPCASFDLSDSAQQRACFHYTNLQPLWQLDNIRKGAKLIYA